MGSLSTYADASFTAAASGVNFGTAVDADGDLNADGYSDVVVGAPGYDDLLVGAPSTDMAASGAGTVYVMLGPILSDRSLSAADARLEGAASGEGLGAFLDGAGDLDNDGYDDYIVGGLGRSKLWVFEGP